jgi:GT2 family glycosyltransferase
MSEPLVSIITVNYNQVGVTCALLESIRKQAYKNVEVIVVDNASHSDPAIIIEAAFPEVTYLRSETNLGFAGGNNLALSKASGKYLFFVNNDAELTEGCLHHLVAALEQDPAAGMVSPLLCYYPTAGLPEVIQYAGMTPVHPFTGRNTTIGALAENKGQYHALTETAYCHGAAMMIPRAVLESVGPMYEGFFLYYEELDWCARIRRAGYKCLVEPRAKVFHKESLTVGQMGSAKTYYLTKNRLLFMRRNLPPWRYALFTVFFWLVTVPVHVLRYLRSGQTDNLRAFLAGSLGKNRSQSVKG